MRVFTYTIDLREEGVKTLIILVVLLALLVSSLLSNIAETNTSIADTNIPDNEVTASIREANNSSESATITITTWTAPLLDE